jgi:hypothetical protein
VQRHGWTCVLAYERHWTSLPQSHGFSSGRVFHRGSEGTKVTQFLRRGLRYSPSCRLPGKLYTRGEGAACYPQARRIPSISQEIHSPSQKEDIAFNLFFGQPVLVVEHQDLFEDVRSLVEGVLVINSIYPAIRWSDLGMTLLNSRLHRRTPAGISHVRAYSRAVWVTNDSDSPGRFVVEWSHSTECSSIDQVLQGGVPIHSSTVGDSTIRVQLSCLLTAARYFPWFIETSTLAWKAWAFSGMQRPLPAEGFPKRETTTLAKAT